MVINYQDFISNVINTPEYLIIGRGMHKKRYLKLHCAFDIETTTLYDTKTSFMYIWQFQINDITIIGRTMNEFIDLLTELKSKLATPSARLIVWVANLGFEFQFIRNYFTISELFAKKKREPLKFLLNDFFEFRDALAISGGSLSQLAKDYTTTQKLVGDLDYTILRSHKTQLTDNELAYCVNDVVILKEFSEYIWSKYIEPEGYIPLTKTGILRREVNQKAKEWSKQKGISFKHLHEYVASLYPSNEEQYTFYMEYLFRGGFTHANNYYVGDTIKGHMLGIDFTSSYPASMLQDYYPITPFKKVDYEPKYLTTKCCILFVVFTNIKAKTSHTIESSNKIIQAKEPIYDNGRLYSAKGIYVCLTELDLASYKEFYEWDSMKVTNMYISDRGLLPTYLLDVLVEYYERKDNLKRSGLSKSPEYALTKAMVNSAYGLTVTRLTFSDVEYSNGEWNLNRSDKSYQDQITNQVLSCFWGIWVTAHSRRKELKTLRLLNKHVAYSDTDSHKLVGFDCLYMIREYNNSIRRKNHRLCNYYGYDKSVLLDIGTFDIEGLIYQFKTLGAKRYIYTDADGLHQTISGLYKTALAEYSEHLDIDAFDIFNDNMYIPSEYTHKLASTYNDMPTDAYICGDYMHALSSVALIPTDFTLRLANDYVQLLLYLTERNLRRFKK